jgi:hypothetical protein
MITPYDTDKAVLDRGCGDAITQSRSCIRPVFDAALKILTVPFLIIQVSDAAREQVNFRILSAKGRAAKHSSILNPPLDS